MPQKSTPLEWLVFLALGIAWGSSYLFIKIGVETLTPFTLIAARLAIGLAVLTVVALVSRVTMPRTRGPYLHLIGVALLGIVIPFSLITWGEQSIDSSLAAIINGTVPLFAIVLAALVLVDEPITVNRLFGLLIGFAGVVILTSPSFDGSKASSLPGELALVGSAISYGASGVYTRRFVKDVSPLAGALLEVGYAFAIMLVLAAIWGDPLSTRIEPSTVLSVVWLGLVGSGLAFIAYFFLIGRWGATRMSLVAYLLPVVGVVLGFVVRGEVITVPVLIGMALIIAGVAFANSRYGQRRLIGRRQPAGGGEATAGARDRAS